MQTHPLAAPADWLIAGYQRYLSPYKGFCCAYRVHTGRASCSDLARRAIRSQGLFSGLGLLTERFRRCKASALALQTAAEAPQQPAQEAAADGAKKSACTVANASCCVEVSACACAPFT